MPFASTEESPAVPEFYPGEESFHHALENANEQLKAKFPLARFKLEGWNREGFEEKAATLDVLADFLSDAAIDDKKLNAIRFVNFEEGVGSSLDLESGLFTVRANTSEAQLMETFGVELGAPQETEELEAEVEDDPDEAAPLVGNRPANTPEVNFHSTLGDLDDFLKEHFSKSYATVSDDFDLFDKADTLIPVVAPLIAALKVEGIQAPKHIHIQKGEKASYNKETGLFSVGSGASEEKLLEVLKSAEGNTPEDTGPKAERGSQFIEGVSVYTSKSAAENATLDEVNALKVQVGEALRMLKAEDLEFVKDKRLKITLTGNGSKRISYWKDDNMLHVGIEESAERIQKAIMNKVITVLRPPKTKDSSLPEPTPESQAGEADQFDWRETNAQQEADEEASENVSEQEPQLRVQENEQLDWQETGAQQEANEEAFTRLEDVEEAEAQYREKKGWRDVATKGVEYYNRARESELTRKVLANKIVNGYLKLSRTQKLAVNMGLIGIGTAIGIASGVAVGTALGVGGARMMRSVASFGGATAMNAAGAFAERILNKKEQKALKELEDSRHSENQKEIYKKTIEGTYQGKKATLAKWRAIGTVAGGVAGGAFASFGDYLTSGGGAVKAVTQNVGGGGAATRAVEIAADAKPKVSETVAAVPEAPVAPVETVPPIISVPKMEAVIQISDAKVHIESGDSVWSSLQEVLEKNEKFSAMTKAQQENVIANLYNVVDDDPSQYGIGEDGMIHPGDDLDFSSLFENSDRIEKIFSHALEVTEPLELPAVELPEAPVIEPQEIIGTPGNTLPPFEEIDHTTQVAPFETEIPQTPQSVPVEVAPTHTVPQVGEVVAVSTQEVDSAFKNGIDSIYGNKGVFGFGKSEGMLSDEWRKIKGLRMPAVLKYYQGDSAASALKPDVVEALAKSDKHFALMKEVEALVASSKGTLKPFESETVEDFLKRSIAFKMKQAQV